MWILMLEAGFALFLLVFIVWWTMFHGREEEPSETGSAPAERKIEDHRGET